MLNAKITGTIIREMILQKGTQPYSRDDILKNLRKSLDPEFEIHITTSYRHPKKPYYASIQSGCLDLFNNGLPESPKNRDYQPTPTRAINNLLTSFLGKRIIYSKHIPFVEIVSKIYDIDLQGNATEVLEAEK